MHLHSHLTLLALWVLLGFLSTGLWGRFFGIHYLLLLPEYRGSVDFLSFFITGASFGIFLMVWHLSTYLLGAYRFPFLATLQQPFTKYSLNNSVVPVLFLCVYIGSTIVMQRRDEFTNSTAIVLNVTGFLLGMAALIGSISGYLHLTNKDILSFLSPGHLIPRPGSVLWSSGRRIPSLREIRKGITRWRVDSYLNERLRLRLVRSVVHYNPRLLKKVFEQNHMNAIVVHVVIMLILVGLGLFMDSPWARIPTAATLFILSALFMAIFGGIVFWFQQWGALVLLFLVVMIDFTTGLGFFNYRNRAYGLDYTEGARTAYTYKVFEHLASPENVEKDKAATLKILENWLYKNKKAGVDKPKMVFIGLSGGGLRSAVWSVQTLQRADQATDGGLLSQTMMFSGASGGMLGAAYLRELYLQKLEGDSINLYDSTYIEDIGKDLLNPVCFSIAANDLFYPLRSFEYAGFKYRKDRGYIFEKQLNENCRGVLGKSLSDYREPELDAKIPMMLISPFVVNDARRLLISPHRLSYLMRAPQGEQGSLDTEIDAVDFMRMFERQQADSLAFSTALRMNSTYPLILPNVMLPTVPATEAMDAGFRDNYGVLSTVRFVQVFEDWIKENTSGVVLVQIRCWEKIDPIPNGDNRSTMDNLFVPLSAAAKITTMQDYQQDNELSLLNSLLGPDRFEMIRFIYEPIKKENEASMSFHLSKRETRDLIKAWDRKENQKELQRLRKLLGSGPVSGN